MSKVKRTICDKCNKQIEENEGYYNADISEFWEEVETGKQICNRGDYCKDCFSMMIVKEIKEYIEKQYFNKKIEKGE